jgi:hypothetical protein
MYLRQTKQKFLYRNKKKHDCVFPLVRTLYSSLRHIYTPENDPDKQRETRLSAPLSEDTVLVFPTPLHSIRLALVPALEKKEFFLIPFHTSAVVLLILVFSTTIPSTHLKLMNHNVHSILEHYNICKGQCTTKPRSRSRMS